MRNLTLYNIRKIDLRDANLTATAVDVEEDAIYTTSEQQDPGGGVYVEVWKVENNENPPSIFAMFSASPNISSGSQVISLHVLGEFRKLAAIMRNGDITMISLEDTTITVEGTVEPWISAAAWSPDESLLAIVSGSDKLILMTSTFDVLSETQIDTTEFGEDAQVNVGWGKKETQFHGSLGKAAAKAAPQSIIGSSPDDDESPRISWRGDGAFFVVSSLSPSGPSLRKRTLRVYDRDGSLQSSSEAVGGLEHTLSWRPSGNLIAGTQRFGFEGGGAGVEGRHDIVFFERNGLRRSEFGVRVSDLPSKGGGEQRKWGYRVREVSWSSDSNVLAVWLERDEGDIVQLWTTGNYHWYLKQEVTAPDKDGHPGRFTSVSWHPEQALHLIFTTQDNIFQRKYAWETFASHSKPPIDTGAVAVIDGTKILLTPFRVQNVPPPMSSSQVVLSDSRPTASEHNRTPIHCGFSSMSDILVVLWESGYVELWSLQTRLDGSRAKAMDPRKIWSGSVKGVKNARQIQLSSTDASGRSSTIVILWTDQGSHHVTFLKLEEFAVASEPTSLTSPHHHYRLVTSDNEVFSQGQNGEIHQYDFDQKQFLPVAYLKESCLQSQCINTPSDGESEGPIFVGMSSSGKLHVASGEFSSTLATSVTSFAVSPTFIIFTTTAHEASFIPVTSLRSRLRSHETADLKPEKLSWETRRVERGSKIVVPVPSAMSLVLQMPRGNLETINPRPLVMEIVKQDIAAHNYRKAFFACRKHRIDLNVLVDHDQTAFLKTITSFVEQIHEVDHINLFLTNLGRGSQSPETIASLCDAIRIELERKNITKYVNSILTAYVVKKPPAHEDALALLLRLRDTNPDVVEDAVRYIIFLVDANQLFDTALGMYDFSLVLMIAQHSQKDPREYLPFLRGLRSLEKYYQRFKIDDHLKRHKSALRNLSLAGADRFEEAAAYVELYRLYDEALQIWRGTDRYNTVLLLYGEWLFERREFRQAASVFVEAQSLSKAMVAHERAFEWQEVFCLANQIGMSEADVSTTGYRVAEDLVSKKRYSEAGRVLLDYSKDTREAVIAYVQGNHFSEARRIITFQSKLELLEEVIHPAALESCAQIMEDVNECKEQLQKQLNRVKELRLRKVASPDAFYGTEDPNLHNVDVMTDASMATTTFTRYTAAPTTASRSSKISSRSKRKLERKIGSGKKGTVDEEEYLLKSVTKLVTRFATIQEEARGLLPHLLQFTAEHRQEGSAMQRYTIQFENELKNALEEIWPQPSTEADVDSWASRRDEAEKESKIDPLKKVPKPDLTNSSQDWEVKLFDFEP